MRHALVLLLILGTISSLYQIAQAITEEEDQIKMREVSGSGDSR